jgi:hypothetical protein
MRRREQYSMFATLAGSKISLLITDVMSSNSRKIHAHWSKTIVEFTPYYNGLRYLICVNLEKGKLHPILKYFFLTSSNRSQSRMKCSIFSLSLQHSKQSIFASFLSIFIRLFWSMYEPVSSLSLVGSL